MFTFLRQIIQCTLTSCTSLLMSQISGFLLLLFSSTYPFVVYVSWNFPLSTSVKAKVDAAGSTLEFRKMIGTPQKCRAGFDFVLLSKDQSGIKKQSQEHLESWSGRNMLPAKTSCNEKFQLNLTALSTKNFKTNKY